MKNISLTKLFRSPEEDDPAFARLLTMILTITLVGSISLTVVELGIFNGKPNIRAAFVLTAIGVVTLYSIRLVMRGYLLPGKLVVPVTTTFAVVYLALTHDGLRSTSMAALPIVIVIASFLLGTKAPFIFGFLAVAAATTIGVADIRGLVNSPISTFTEWEDILIYDMLLVTLALLLRVLLGHLNNAIHKARENEAAQKKANIEIRELQSSLEEKVAVRTAQLKATNEVARVASSILDPDELITRVVNVITEQFDYYYAAIFLLDESEDWAVLMAATGEAGQKLKENGHRLQIGGKSMVSASIVSRDARVALDVGTEAIRFDNPLLPKTRSEIALPLKIGDKVLGALDVQSVHENDFNQQDIETLQSMTNQVSIALENARLFQETEKNLKEIQQIYNQYVVGTWSEISQSGGLKVEYKTAGPERDNMKELSLPLSLRDQVIGKISFEREDEFTAEELSLIEAISTQAVLALENARLVEQSQQTALQERLASDIGQKVWSSTSIEGVLQTAIKELGRSLNVSEATIELRMKN